MMRPVARLVAIAVLVAPLVNAVTARADEPVPGHSEAAGEGFMLGASVGALLPVVFQPEFIAGVTSGVSLSANAGYRFAKYFYLGAVYQHGFLGGEAWHGYITNSASTDYAGFNFVTISSPNASVALFTEVGAGYRVVTTSTTIPGAALPPSTLTESGFETTFLGLGVEIKLADHVRIVPEVTLAAGPTAAFGLLGVTAYFDFAGSTHRS